MVGQLRIYTINKGMMDSWLKLFHETIAPKTLEFGMGIQSAWTDAWQANEAPDPLPMPLQGILSRPPMDKIDRLAASGHEGAAALATDYVGQAVGLMNQEKSARSVVYEFMEDFAESVDRLANTLD